MLDYTQDAIRSMKEYETRGFEHPNVCVFTLVQEGRISPDDGLWYQAVNGFSYLCLQADAAVQIARELRRTVFLHKLHGFSDGERCFLPDGSCYAGLMEEPLLEKMVDAVKQCYKKCDVQRDVGISEKVPQTPCAIRKLLLEGTLDRNVLLRVGFALELDMEAFNKLITSGGCFRKLSPAVPRDLILMYCLENRIYDWKQVNRLQEEAMADREKAIQHEQVHILSEELDTGYAERNWGTGLHGMAQDDFVQNCLIPCCHIAVRKENFELKESLQFSYRALTIMRQNTVLRDVRTGISNCRSGRYHSVYNTDTVNRYTEAFGLSEEYGLKGTPGKIMSIDGYCRFLSYRILVPPRGKKSYMLRYSRLPAPLKENVLKHYHISNLRSIDDHSETAGKVQPQRVRRHMILLAGFYDLLMEWWHSGEPFITADKETAKRLWKIFFSRVNNNLKDCGYPVISQKYPMDLLMRICMLSLNPLECYNRIYQLAILESLSLDPKGYSKENYPSKACIEEVLIQLRRSGDALASCTADSNYRVVCDTLCSQVEAQLSN